MNLFSLIYSSSLIYPKDEEKRRNVSYLRLPEVLRKFKTGPCGTFQVSAPRGSLMPRQHAQREHRTRRLGLTEEEEMRRVRRILVLLQAKQYKQKMGRALEPCTGPIHHSTRGFLPDPHQTSRLGPALLGPSGHNCTTISRVSCSDSLGS